MHSLLHVSYVNSEFLGNQNWAVSVFKSVGVAVLVIPVVLMP